MSVCVRVCVCVCVEFTVSSSDSVPGDRCEAGEAVSAPSTSVACLLRRG